MDSIKIYSASDVFHTKDEAVQKSRKLKKEGKTSYIAKSKNREVYYLFEETEQ